MNINLYLLDQLLNVHIFHITSFGFGFLLDQCFKFMFDTNNIKAISLTKSRHPEGNLCGDFNIYRGEIG